MIIDYRNFRFPPAAVGPQIFVDAVRNDANDIYAYKHRWILDGMILNPSGDLGQMGTKIVAAQTAFAADYGDLIMYQPDGSSKTVHQLINQNTIGGVRVTRPLHFPKSEGAEYVTYRTFQIEVEGLLPLAQPDSLLQSWQEQLQFVGGGPEFAWQQVLFGKPIPYTARQATTYTVVQSGSAVGLYSYPTLPQPIWPDFWKPHLSTIVPGTPKPVGGGRSMFYPVSWQHFFESSDPLFGYPTQWPGK